MAINKSREKTEDTVRPASLSQKSISKLLLSEKRLTKANAAMMLRIERLKAENKKLKISHNELKINCRNLKIKDAAISKLRADTNLLITEFHQARNELSKSQELINSVFHTADIGIAVIAENGRFIKTNAGYDKIFGYKEGELIRKRFTVVVPPKLRKESLVKLKAFFSGNNENEESQAIKKRGELFYIFRTSGLFKSQDGSKYLVTTVRDISETKKYQALLHNTEKIAQFAGWEMDVVADKMVRTDELYNIIELSRAHVEELWRQKKLEEIYVPESRPLLRKSMNDAIHKGKPFDVELCLTTGTQKKKWVRLICRPERIHSKTIKLVGTLHDITFQKETEAELERMSLVASKTNNAVFITDEFGKTVWMNGSVEKMTGYCREELIGKTPGSMLQGSDTDRAAISRMSKNLKKHLPVSEVLKNYRKDGSAFWINMDIAPVFKNNHLVNFIGIGVDVTELVKARESEKQKDLLEQQQKLFNAIARNFPDGIIGVLDEKFHYVFVGGAEIKKLGLAEHNFIGNNIFDHLSKKSNEYALPFLTKATTGKTVSFEAEMHDKIYSVSAVPLFKEDDGAVKQILIVLYNITERKKAEKEVWEALTKQQELNEMKSKFVTIASHEFRTPLSAILSSTYLISKYSEAHEHEKAQRHIERIETSVRALTDILNDFLSLGKIEDGKLKNNISDFNVEEFCKMVVDEMIPTIKKGQTIFYAHKGQTNIFCLDKQHLKNVLTNLLSNACKYSAEGKNIWLTSAKKNGQMQFTVKDEGIGIPEEDQPNLFQTFFRANNAGNIQGTGMGLHIVKRFLDIMGGNVHVKSKLNEGAEFVIQFPVQRQLN